MTLAAGARLGPYEILSALGAGGMGEVYRARDATLNRDVALKVLPELFALDLDRLARFKREAQVLASLNHPNIAHVYGLEDSHGVRALVMELVEGPTLADRIAQGAIPLDEAVPIAKQIALALEAAHEQGIVHRDLKPANIKVRPDGTVKVLDFGLAKAIDSPAGTQPAALSNSPTLTSPTMMTGVGVILGTAAYMSPEQTKGRAADKRSDIWAFGCVFYEMLTGRRAFYGEDVSDTLAAVLRGEPDWNALPAGVPPAVRALIQGCLRKDRKERIGDISTALFVLGQPHAVIQSALVAPPPVWRRAMLVGAGVLVGAVIAAAMLWRRDPPPAGPVTRFVVTLPQGQQLILGRQALALSPDGTRIVFAADSGLFLRSMSDLEVRPIPGTKGAINPVFSPDGQSLAFYADAALKRIAIGGGTALTISPWGAAPPVITWSNDSILFGAPMGMIMRVPAKGGKPEVLVDLNSSEFQPFGPQLLPDGRTVLFTIVKRTTTDQTNIDSWDAAQIVVQSLETGVRKPLIEGGGDGRYVPTGHIVYAAGGTLFAVPFDLPRLEVTGGAVPVVEGVRRAQFGTVGSAVFAFSQTGSLVYAPGPASPRQQDLVLFDRMGGAEALGLPQGNYNFPRVSPDGKRIAFETSEGTRRAVSIYELSGAIAPTRLIFGGDNRYPIWAGDRRVAFQSDQGGDRAVWWQPIEGGNAERLTKPDEGASHVPESWSPNGDVLLFSETKDSRWSLWTLSRKDQRVTPFGGVKGSLIPTDAMFSPDGKWVAYQFGDQPEVAEGTTYVQPFPATGSTNQLPIRGGRPLWSRDGKELFFIPTGTQFSVVNVRTEPSVSFTNPVAIPRGFGVAAPTAPRTFDVMPDGRIVAVGIQGQSQVTAGPSQIHVVLNWFEELKARAPTK